MKLVLVAALLFCVPAAQAAEDPAIALCEILIKSELVAPKSYERVSAHVVGLTASVSENAPSRRTQNRSLAKNALS